MPDHDENNSQDETPDENELISNRQLTTEEIAEELEQGNAQYIMNRDLIFDEDDKTPSY
jgi:hypothetical protein